MRSRIHSLGKNNSSKGCAVLAALGLTLMIGCGGGAGGGEAKNSTTLSSGKVNACTSIGWKIANGGVCELPDDPTASSLVRLRIISADGISFGWCTGTVIDPHVVLTAGHCLAEGASQVEIDTTAGTVTAAQAVMHPGYTTAETGSGQVLFNDVALLITEQPLDVVPASVLVSRAPEDGEPVIVAGFGITQPEGHAGVMNAGNATVRNSSENHIFIQYKDDESHPCPGDSGGPLLVMQDGVWVIAGVVSQSDPTITGKQMCRPGDITLYANAQNPGILAFIQSYAPNVAMR